MRTIISIVATFLLMSATFVEGGGWTPDERICGSAVEVWPADNDGSVRLTFKGRGQAYERLELIQRQAEGVLVCRGYAEGEGTFREIYAVYDMNNGNLVHALGKKGLFVGQEGLPNAYSMQSRFDIRVYSTDNSYNEAIRALLAKNQDHGCREELLKKSQGRVYDKERCHDLDDPSNLFLQVMLQFAYPETAGFNETTASKQIKGAIEGLRAGHSKFVLGIFTDRNDPEGDKRHYCTGIQKMDMKIIDALRNPDNQKILAIKKKMPDYLQ